MSRTRSQARTPTPRIFRLLAAERQFWRRERSVPHYGLISAPPDYSSLPVYPIDMSPLLAMPYGWLDDAGILYNAPTHRYPGSYQPTSIAQYALAHWNAYLTTRDDAHREACLRQARWLLEHEVRIADGKGGWPISFGLAKYGANPQWMSALTQGNVISVFVRAYLLTGETAFLESAHRAVRTFQCDVLDGGVQVPVGADGCFFEEVAVYPASHILNGFILALFGLYDYVAVTRDGVIDALIGSSLRTLHTMLDEYDAGYWSFYELLHRNLATKFYHALHVVLLQALAGYSGCTHCAVLAERWAQYQRGRGTRFRYWVASRVNRYVFGVLRRASGAAPANHQEGGGGATLELVSIPITAFPVPGGMRSVLTGVASVMRATWKIEYLTRQVGADRRGLAIYGFGGRMATPRYMPSAWLYCLSGWRKLAWLVRHGHRYRLILPQDGVYTGVFAALIGKPRGIRVVCMDHGTVTLPYSAAYRQERINALKARSWPLRWLLRIGLLGYLPALRLMTRLAMQDIDHFLVAGDEVYDVYRRRFGVPARCITRYPYVVDLVRFAPPNTSTRLDLCAHLRFPSDAIVITMINRLAPEKGLDIALRGLGHAITALPQTLRARVRVVIAGDGPLRQRVAVDRQTYAIEDVCSLWGEAAPEDVVRLLAVSDIFLYTGTRGTNYSMAVLEAMAAGCAVIATVEPRSNVQLLAEERGIAIPVGDAGAVSEALAQLIGDPLRRERLGRNAREYVAQHHSATALKRCLLRATYWPGWSGRAVTFTGGAAHVSVSAHQAERL